MNDDDEWDSHVEIVISEDDCPEQEEIVSHTGDNNDPTVALPKEDMIKLREMLNIDQDVSEFYIRGQATLLEQAHTAAQSKNLTKLVTFPASTPQDHAVTEEQVLRELEPINFRGNGNKTWAP